jgi:hypothetical protein
MYCCHGQERRAVDMSESTSIESVTSRGGQLDLRSEAQRAPGRHTRLLKLTHLYDGHHWLSRFLNDSFKEGSAGTEQELEGQRMLVVIVGGILFLLFLGFWFWHSPTRRKLTRAEIDRYLAAAGKLSLPAEDKAATRARLRRWAESDNGKPVYMLNLMRFYPQLRRFPGSPDFPGTPEEANAFYEKRVLRLLFLRAGYPLMAGRPQADALMEVPPELDGWSRVVVVRYPNRRAFLSLVADPAYAPLAPYKFMALELVLVPVAAEVTVPDLRLVVGGGLLILYLAVGWALAALGSP